jgi:hypothetical protein
VARVGGMTLNIEKNIFMNREELIGEYEMAGYE